MIASFINDIQAWYEQPAGLWLLDHERKLLQKMCSPSAGNYLLQLSLVDKAAMLVSRHLLQKHIILTPHITQHSTIIGDFTELPIATESIHTVLVHHWLGLLDNPISALQEIFRVLAPEGKIIVCGLAPAKYWKYYDQLHHQQHFPHSLHSANATQARKWLLETGFTFEALIYHSYGLSLQLHNAAIASKIVPLLPLIQYLSKLGLPAGGYILIMEKNVEALTPIKLGWEKPEWDIPKNVKPVSPAGFES